MKRLTAIVATALALSCPARAAVAADEEVWPMPEWKKATPADVGLDAAKLDEARKACIEVGQEDLAGKLDEAKRMLSAGDLKVFRKNLETVVARLGHLR